MALLVDLDPQWVFHGARGVVGLSYDCPCGGSCGERAFVAFENPPDGGPREPGFPSYWRRTGLSFETMTLEPSILRRAACGWHGFLVNGTFKPA